MGLVADDREQIHVVADDREQIHVDSEGGEGGWWQMAESRSMWIMEEGVRWQTTSF